MRLTSGSLGGASNVDPFGRQRLVPVWVFAGFMLLLLLTAACGGGDESETPVGADGAAVSEVTGPGDVPATVDPSAFLGGVFGRELGGTLEPEPSVVPGGLSELTPLESFSAGVEVGAQRERRERVSLCNDAWRNTMLRLGNTADYAAISAELLTFRSDFVDCEERVWSLVLRPEVSPACEDVMFGQGFGPLSAAERTGWHFDGRALWVNFEQSPLGTGGGCWLYVDSVGWLGRSGDGWETPRLLTIFEMDASAPGYGVFRDNAMLNCDHRLRGDLGILEGVFDAQQLAAMVRAFRGAAGNIECAGVGWVPVLVETSDSCLGVIAGDRPSGVYDDGVIVLHWADDAVLGSGGECWTYDPVEGAWFRSLDRGQVEPGASAQMAPLQPGGMVNDIGGKAFEVDAPLAGGITVLGDDAPLISDPGRSEVCDLILKSVLMLNPGPRTPPDYAFLINAVQHGVDGGVCVPERWAPGVRGRMLRDTAAGVALPDSLRAGTGYDEETGSLRVVFFDDERPFDGAREWIWLSGGTGWQSLR